MVKKCKQCKNYYNFTNRKPIVITECGCTHCLECILTLLEGNQQRQIVCPGCDETTTLPEQLKENVQIMKDLKSSDSLTIVCEEHESKTTNFYCLSCEIPVCSICKLGSHKDHPLIDMKQSKFKIYSENVKELIDGYSPQNMKSQLEKYALNEAQMTSSQFKSMVSKISRMFGHLADDEERNKIDLVSCLEEVQNEPQNWKQFQKLSKPTIAGDLEPFGLSKLDIQNLINESQSVLREEFKQALDTFESVSIQKEKIMKDQTNQKLIDIQTNIEEKIQKFKQDFLSDLEVRLSLADKDINLQQKLNYFEKESISINQQLREINVNIEGDSRIFNRQLRELRSQIEIIKKCDVKRIDKLESSLLIFQLKMSSQRNNPDIAPVDQISKSEIKNNEIQDQPDKEEVKENRDKMAGFFQRLIKQGFEQKISIFTKLVHEEISKTDQSLLKPLLIKDGNDKKFELLFKGSVDGYKSAKLHELCADKGSTVYFIMSEFKEVFGGYASLPLKSPETGKSHFSEAFK
eukprot:403333740